MRTRMPVRSGTVDHRLEPELRITRYDRISSLLMAVVLGLIVVVLSVFTWRKDDRIVKSGGDKHVGTELLNGDEHDDLAEGMPTVESPAEPVVNASLDAAEFERPQVAASLSAVMELADRATELLSAVSESPMDVSGIPGSSVGEDLNSIGTGNGARRREQRWYIHFGDVSSVDEYAHQLDSLGIELGAMLPGGEVVYVSMLGSGTPHKRVSRVTDGDDRLYMSWQGTARRAADEELFRRAGVEVGDARILHFYSRATEESLARLEREFANRNADEIRRTYFVIRPQGTGYRFVVTHQTALK